MSYRDFDRGIPPDEIQRRKREEGEQSRASSKLSCWSDSEHISGLLRTLGAAKDHIGELEPKVWREATGQRKLPPRFYEAFEIEGRRR